MLDINARVQGRPGFLPIIALVKHRLPKAKGQSRTVDVEIKYQPIIDKTRYPGYRLRVMRSYGKYR